MEPQHGTWKDNRRDFIDGGHADGHFGAVRDPNLIGNT